MTMMLHRLPHESDSTCTGGGLDLPLSSSPGRARPCWPRATRVGPC